MKYKIKIAKCLKLFSKLEDNTDSLCVVIDTYFDTYHGIQGSLARVTLDRALFNMVKKIDRSKLMVDIFVHEPKFTEQCPTDLVKYEYQKFFVDDDGYLISKRFFQLLQLVGVEKFTIDYDEATDGDDCYDG